MFKGLSEGWPGENCIPPYIRPAEERAHDFELVNQGYLGYMSLGYSAREVELFVWLEVLRDKQCEDRPCEIGVLLHGKAEPKGGCPVKIHIPEMLDLLGTGQVPRGAGADRELQPAAERHRPRLPAGTAVPGRVHASPSGRSRSASSNGILPAARKLVNPNAAERFAGLRRARGPRPTSRRSRWSAPARRA